jgi:hypothetical protein
VLTNNKMKAPLIDQRLELVILSAVAASACGLASTGDLLFVALFDAASIITIIEALQRLR